MTKDMGILRLTVSEGRAPFELTVGGMAEWLKATDCKSVLV